jgi:hypothetical protein
MGMLLGPDPAGAHSAARNQYDSAEYDRKRPISHAWIGDFASDSVRDNFDGHYLRESFERQI